MKMRGWVFLLLLFVGCRESAEITTGILRADMPLQTPLSGQPACAVHLHWYGRYRPSGNDGFSRTTPTQYAADATIEIDGNIYTINGTGGQTGRKVAGEQWNWQWELTDDGVQTPITPPATLYGWQTPLDNLLDTISNQTVSTTETLSVLEYYIPCDEAVAIAGEIVGNEFRVSP